MKKPTGGAAKSVQVEGVYHSKKTTAEGIKKNCFVLFRDPLQLYIHLFHVDKGSCMFHTCMYYICYVISKVRAEVRAGLEVGCDAACGTDIHFLAESEYIVYLKVQCDIQLLQTFGLPCS